MCFTVDIFYSCKGDCLGRNGKKFSVVFDGKRQDLPDFQVCPQVREGKARTGPRKQYQYIYPIKCWTCQAAWAEKMKPSPAEVRKLRKRLEAFCGETETDREIDERVRRIENTAKWLISKYINNTETKERKLDSELQSILSDTHRKPCKITDGQARLNKVTKPVDYVKFEMDRTLILEISTGSRLTS